MYTRSWLQLNLLVGAVLASACGETSTTDPNTADGGASSGGPDSGCPRAVVKKEFTRDITGDDLCVALGEAAQYQYIGSGPGRGTPSVPAGCGPCNDPDINTCTVHQATLERIGELAGQAIDAGTDGGTWCAELASQSATIVLTCRKVVIEGTQTSGCPVEGRRPEHFRLRAFDAGSTVVGRYLAACAELEAASVPAFERLARELAVHGAPAALVRRATHAGSDEVRHAEQVIRLARAHGGDPQAYESQPLAVRPLVEIAIENAIEGVVREGFGAVQALCKARRAQDPELRATYLTIAIEECAHVDLARDVARFCDEQLDADERQRVLSAKERAIAELEAELRAEVHPRLVRQLGLPNRAEALALVAGLRRDMWQNQSTAA